MATIRKRTNKGATTYQVDWRDASGKRKMKIFKKLKEANAHRIEVEASLKHGDYEDKFEDKKILFDELAARYLENFTYQKSYRDKKRNVHYALKEFGGLQLKKISYMHIETYRNKRKGTVLKSGKPRTDATVNREMAALRNMFSKAVEWGLIETNPFHKGSRLTFKENNQRQRYLTLEEIEKLLNHCSPHLQPIVELALHTGLRKSELLKLEYSQVQDGFIYLKETKSGKGRQVPLDERAAQVIKEQQIRNKWKSPFVCVGPDGGRLRDVKKGFSGALRRAGIDDFKFHDLRHTFASHLVMKGANLKAVQRLLGHSDSKMTDRYSHLSPDHLRESVNLLNNLPSGKELVNILELKPSKHGAGRGI